jgi:hypothetical protein
MTDGKLFLERQHFRQAWLWTILLLINGLLIFALVKQILFGQPFGNRPLSNVQLLFVATSVLVITLFVAILRLETEIKADGVYYKFFPFQLSMKKISWDRISNAYVRKYKPLLEYGGWGLRIGIFGSGQAFNVSGNKGLQLIYDKGRKFLIGTRKPEELKKALQQLGRLSND